MGERCEQKEQPSLRQHLTMWTCWTGRIKKLFRGRGTHLGGVVVQKRTKVNIINASEKVTVDVLVRRILDYGIVKAEKATNLV